MAITESPFAFGSRVLWSLTLFSGNDFMTTTIQTTVIVLLLSGITISLCGSIAMIFWKKREVTRRDVFWAGSRAAVHPECYVRADRIKTVKLIHLVGVALFLTGVLILLACGL